MARVAATEFQYARSGGVAIAYQVVGEGDTDLVYVPDYMSNLVYAWEYPRWRDFYLQLASRFRLILFDKRGTGLSDHGGQFATLETRMEDLHAVLDAAGSARTVILASHEGCGMAALYAATYPERTAALALFHPRAYGHGLEDADGIAALADLRDRWGTDALSDEIMRDGCPSLFRKRGGAALVRELPPYRRKPSGGVCPQPRLRGDRPARRLAGRASTNGGAAPRVRPGQRP